MSGATQTTPEVKVKSIDELKRDHSLRIRSIAGLACDIDSMMTQAFHAAAIDLGPTAAQDMLDMAKKLAQEKLR